LQEFKTPLLFPLEGYLVGPELLDQRFFFGISRRSHSGVLEANGDAVVPARVLRHMVGRSFNLHREHSPALHALLEQWIVVPQEKLQELLLMTPLHFVVILHAIGLVSRGLGRRSLGPRPHRQRKKQHRRQQISHATSHGWCTGL